MIAYKRGYSAVPGRHLHQAWPRYSDCPELHLHRAVLQVVEKRFAGFVEPRLHVVL